MKARGVLEGWGGWDISGCYHLPTKQLWQERSRTNCHPQAVSLYSAEHLWEMAGSSCCGYSCPMIPRTLLSKHLLGAMMPLVRLLHPHPLGVGLRGVASSPVPEPGCLPIMVSASCPQWAKQPSAPLPTPPAETQRLTHREVEQFLVGSHIAKDSEPQPPQRPFSVPQAQTHDLKKGRWEPYVHRILA